MNTRPLSSVPIERKPIVTCAPALVKRAVDAFLAPEREGEEVFFDIETTGLDPRANKLVMVQLTQKSSPTALVIDARPFADPAFAQQRKAILADLKRLFAIKRAVGHNIKFDSEFMLAYGVRMPHVFDTMIAEQLLLGTGYGHGDGLHLKDTLARRLGIEMDKLAREWFYKPAPLDERPDDWNAPFPEEEVAYGAKDVDLLVPLYDAQRELLRRDKLREVAYIEMRALPVIAAMEMRGIRINTEGWRAFIAAQEQVAKGLEAEALGVFGPPILDARIARFDAQLAEWKAAREALKTFETALRATYEEKVADSVGVGWGDYKRRKTAEYRAEHPIPAKPKCDTSLPNIGSTHQLIDALEGLGVPVPTKRNDKGEVVKTTDSDSLERLAPKHPELKGILEYRKASKFVDAFGEKVLARAAEEMLPVAWDEDGEPTEWERVYALHSDYRQIGADTGRMSCANPNFQQVPSKGEGAKLRENVIARPGYKLITADLSNFELRALADLSGDEQMLSMFATGQDLHSYTAKLMFHLPMEWDKERCDHEEWRGGISYRKAAKIVNYLIPYGGSAFAIAQQNNIPQAEADELLGTWQTMFKGAQAFLEERAREVHKTLVSRTKAGRLRRYIPPADLEPRRLREYIPHDPIPAGFAKMQGKRLLIEDYDHFSAREKEWKRAWGNIERQARNTPMQGMNADVIKLAMALFYEATPPRVGVIVAAVHDELVVEAPLARVTEAAARLADAMEQAPKKYLKRVTIPRPEPTVSDHWFHD